MATANAETFFTVEDPGGEARSAASAYSSHARAGRLRIAPGLEVETPVFMPVGTVGSVKGLWQEDLEEIGYNLILGNT
ncbi:MAG: hypothetical protein RIF32_04880, partial [Leptospirales bacterium]